MTEDELMGIASKSAEREKKHMKTHFHTLKFIQHIPAFVTSDSKIFDFKTPEEFYSNELISYIKQKCVAMGILSIDNDTIDGKKRATFGVSYSEFDEEYHGHFNYYVLGFIHAVDDIYDFDDYIRYDIKFPSLCKAIHKPDCDVVTYEYLHDKLRDSMNYDDYHEIVNRYVKDVNKCTCGYEEKDK